MNMIENNYDENNYIQVNGNEYLMGIIIKNKQKMKELTKLNIIIIIIFKY